MPAKIATPRRSTSEATAKPSGGRIQYTVTITAKAVATNLVDEGKLLLKQKKFKEAIEKFTNAQDTEGNIVMMTQYVGDA